MNSKRPVTPSPVRRLVAAVTSSRFVLAVPLAAAKPFSTVFWLCYAPGMASDALLAALPALYALFGRSAGIFIAAAAVVSSAQELLLICRAETLERDRKWIWLAR